MTRMTDREIAVERELAEARDEGRVREIAERIRPAGLGGWDYEACVRYVDEAVRRGFAAGRAAENEACEEQLREQASQHEQIAESCPDIAEPQLIRAQCLNVEADAIAARRGCGR